MSADSIRGKTLRWTYEDGPMAGKLFEHTFDQDGTVRFRTIDDTEKTPKPADERKGTHYEVASINDEVCAVAYLSDSGFTLTTVLDFKTGILVSFSSNEKELMVQHGRFEQVRRAA